MRLSASRASAIGVRSSAYSSVKPPASSASVLTTEDGHAPAAASGTPGSCHFSGCEGCLSMRRHCALRPTAGLATRAISIVTPKAYLRAHPSHQSRADATVHASYMRVNEFAHVCAQTRPSTLSAAAH